MKLIKGTCPNCGAPIDIDVTKDAAICEFCNTPYVVKKAITNIHVGDTNINIDNRTGKNHDAFWEFMKELLKGDNAILLIMIILLVFALIFYLIG